MKRRQRKRLRRRNCEETFIQQTRFISVHFVGWMGYRLNVFVIFYVFACYKYKPLIKLKFTFHLLRRKSRHYIWMLRIEEPIYRWGGPVLNQFGWAQNQGTGHWSHKNGFYGTGDQSLDSGTSRTDLGPVPPNGILAPQFSTFKYNGGIFCATDEK